MPPPLGVAAVEVVGVLAPQAPVVVVLAPRAPVAVAPGRVRRSTTARLMPVPTMSVALASITSTSTATSTSMSKVMAAAAAVGTAVAVTSAVVGSMVRSVPPSCVPVNYGGMVYQQCGSTWYQPQGSQYVVVNPPY